VSTMSTHGAQGVAAGPGAAVVGTGVVGLATALGCAQSGVPVTLIGPCPVGPAGKPSGRTVALSPEAGRLPAEAGRQPGEGWDPRIYAISAASRELLERERVWPEASPPAVTRSRHAPSPSARAQIERQTATVHECRLPAWARAMVAAELAERERLEIRADLARAGLL